MHHLRAFVLDHARLTLVLLALVLVVKAALPAGFMIATDGERFLTVTVCSDATGVPKQMKIALPGKDTAKADHAEAADKGAPCAFAGLGHAMLGGADALLLAAALAFILLTGFAPVIAPRLRGTHYLRPPLRGPPLKSL